MAGWSLGVFQEFMSGNAGVFEDSTKEADADLVRRNRHVILLFVERHVASFLPEQADAELIAEDFDKLVAVNGLSLLKNRHAFSGE